MNESQLRALGATILAILAMFFFSSVGLILVSSVLGMLYPGAAEDIGSIPINAQLILNAVASILMFYLPIHVITAYYLKENTLKSWNLVQKPSSKPIALTVLALLVSMPFLSFLQEFMEGLPWVQQFSGLDEQVNNEYLKFLKEINSIPNTLLMLFGMAIIPAIVEEICFRGFFQNMFGRFMPWWLSILVAAFIFSAVHMQVAQLPLRMVMGIILGYSYYYTRNLWVPIIGHFLNNGIIVIQAYLLNLSGATTEELLEEGMDVSPWLAIISCLACIGIMYCFKLFIPKQTDNHE